MDERDFRILLELHRRPFASYEAIGRSIGTTGTTVKTRVEAMERRGALLGFYVSPVARVFRRFRRIFAFGTRSEPDLRDVISIDPVSSVWRGRPGMVIVNTYSLTPDAPPPPELLKLFGQAPLGTVQPDSPQTGPSSDAILSPLDWRVLEVLLDRPRSPLADLAKAAGLSARTVRNRRDALLKKGLLEVTPIMDTSREPGLIVYAGYVSVEKRSNLRGVRAPGLALVWTHYDPPAAAIVGRSATYAEAREVERHLRELPGATQVELTFPRGGTSATERLLGWVRAERERWKAVGTSPAFSQ